MAADESRFEGWCVERWWREDIAYLLNHLLEETERQRDRDRDRDRDRGTETVTDRRSLGSKTQGQI